MNVNPIHGGSDPSGQLANQSQQQTIAQVAKKLGVKPQALKSALQAAQSGGASSPAASLNKQMASIAKRLGVTLTALQTAVAQLKSMGLNPNPLATALNRLAEAKKSEASAAQHPSSEVAQAAKSGPGAVDERV